MAPSKNAPVGSSSIPQLIEKKRDGEELPDEDIKRLITGFVDGTVTDYQMTAFSMAVYFKGMTPRETVALTLAMRDSGKTANLKNIKGIKVDKHSTGGVGDKISLCLAPWVAACGVPVPMISGRGLGHTGGTLDKLESIPGFSVDRSIGAFAEQTASVGCAMIGQTEDLAPADRMLYALRDVTATTESIPLIVASILSKKLAAGIDALVLDVKVGRGAFMKELDQAKELARSLVRVGTLAGIKVSAILTDMEAPLGCAIGNALEVAEALEVLHGRGPADVVELTTVLGVEMLRLGGIETSTTRARRRLEEAIQNGTALSKMRAIIEAQGGDPQVVDEPQRLPKAKKIVPLKTTRTGYIMALDAREIGLAAVALGAGRHRSDDTIDPSVGIVLKKKAGDKIDRGDVLADIHASNARTANAASEKVAAAFTVGRRPPKQRTMVITAVRR